MKTLSQLNFPKYSFRFKKAPSGEPLIFDSIRKKWLVLTPEEWVRQNLIEFLVKELNYPSSMFQIETGLQINQNQRRSDVLIYKNSKPYILVECKAPNISLSDKVLNQALNYNIEYNCPIIILSNGLMHASFEKIQDEFKPLTGFPKY